MYINVLIGMETNYYGDDKTIKWAMMLDKTLLNKQWTYTAIAPITSL